MEFSLKNHYIKKFLSNYSNQNELKIIKYLTIIGIHSLQSGGQKEKLSYFDLKKIAKQISKAVPKEDKKLNKELNIIKNELAKLNEKFEDKLKTLPLSITENIQELTYPRSVSAQRDYETMRNMTKRALPTYREGEKLITEDTHTGRRANSNEPIPHETLLGAHDHLEHKSKTEVTLKPNEIVLPRIDPRENKNFITKHHLDDTEFKSTLNEVGIIYFPEKERIEEVKKQQKILAQQKELIKTKHAEKKKKKETNNNENEAHPPQAAFFSMTKGQQQMNENLNVGESTKKSKRADDYKPKPLQPHNREENYQNYVAFDKMERPLAQNTFGPSHPSGKKTQKAKGKTSKVSEDRGGKGHENRKKSESRLNRTERETYKEYNEVESKIKDKVKYDKEVSRQYKKMKENMKQYDNYGGDNNVSSSSSQRPQHDGTTKFESREHKALARHRLSQETSQNQSAYYDNSKLLDSHSSARKSMNIPHYSGHLLERTVDDMSAAKHKKAEMTGKNDDFSYHKSIGGDNQGGGILDIANSFLNSPLMQHLSNIDSKDSDASSKVSSPHDEASKRHLRVTNFDSRSPPAFIKSPSKRYGGEDDLRRVEPQSAKNYRPITHQHKYSDWVGVYKADNEGKDSYSLLKESEQKRFAENLSKDSRGYYSKDDTSSLTSSAFSNYLNDEMKDFFQKETYELNKGKTSRSIAKGGSKNPPASSFHGGYELNQTIGGEAPSLHSRKLTHYNQYDTNKSYSGFPTEHTNIFKNDRMNGTRFLNS